jgi:hypothetical protein
VPRPSIGGSSSWVSPTNEVYILVNSPAA